MNRRSSSLVSSSGNVLLGNFENSEVKLRATREGAGASEWTTEEEESIISGVEKFGIGRWAEIRDEYKNVFQNRSSVDIKDKYRNLQKKART